MLTKYRSSIKLTAIGDALGWITEFERSPETLFNKYGVEFIDNYRDWQKQAGGRFYGYMDNIAAGSYSDDTQLMLAVYRSIDGDGRVDNNYFSKVELHLWLKYARGGGRTIKNAAAKIARKSAAWNNNYFTYSVKDKKIDYREMGANGAAMRILPIALANYDNSNFILKEVFKNSIITHGHPRAIIGAMLYAYSINHILSYDKNSFNPLEFITHLGQNISNDFKLDTIIEKDIADWILVWNKSQDIKFEKEYNKVIEESKSSLRLIYNTINNKLSEEECIAQLGCFHPDSKSSGISTVVCAILLASKYYDKKTMAIEIAVNLFGSDTDSIAGFTGGLLGALLGEEIINKKWLEVQDKEYLDNISEGLISIAKFKKNKQFELEEYNSHFNLEQLSADSLEVNQDIYFKPLGKGKIVSLDRQDTLTKGKYNLIYDVIFDIGQSCRFSQIFNKESV